MQPFYDTIMSKMFAKVWHHYEKLFDKQPSAKVDIIEFILVVRRQAAQAAKLRHPVAARQMPIIYNVVPVSCSAYRLYAQFLSRASQ